MNCVVLIPPRIRSVIRDLLGLRLKAHGLFLEHVRDKCGLAIGGPSGTFRDSGLVPLYRFVRSLDNCVFASTTIWEGTREDRSPFIFDERKPAGCNYVLEATSLDAIADSAYDFLLSAHNLEHVANPVKALKEWQRVLRPGGSVILILPDYRKTFDHRRQTTSVTHMFEDFERGTTEDDPTHIAEVLALHDFSQDPIGGDYEDFRRRVLDNSQYRTVHHHVFDEVNSSELLQALGMVVKCVELAPPHHMVLLAQIP
jgi:SAM-dependent methyltransferase